MWGNTFGWILSAIVTAVAVVLAVVLWQKGQPTPPTEFSVSASFPLGAITSTATVAGLDGTDPTTNAGTFYRDAINDVGPSSADRWLAYQQFNKNIADSAVADAKEFKAVGMIVDGAKGQSMDLYKSKPKEIANYENTVDSLDQLKMAAETAMHVALLDYSSDHLDDAAKLARAVEVLGYNLYKERITYDELSAGESLMGVGGDLLVMIAQKQTDSATVEKQAAFKTARIEEYKKKIEPAIQVMKSLGDQTLDDHAGDFFTIAANPKAEKVWRVEAVRRIGRLIRSATNKADQTRAPRFLTKMAGDETQDPVMRAAAEVARNITAKDFQAAR